MALDKSDNEEATLAQLFKQEKYRVQLANLSVTGTKSVFVDFVDLLQLNSAIARKLIAKPEEYLGNLQCIAYEQLRIEDDDYAEAIDKEQICIRINRLEETQRLRYLGSEHLDKLVMVEGVITGATPVNPTVKNGAFKCKRCGTINLIQQSTSFLVPPKVCISPDCGREGPFAFVRDESVFIDCQELRLQEPPEELPPGQIPQTLEIRLLGKELMEKARPGDHARIVGVLYASPKNTLNGGKLCEHNKVLNANSIDVLEKDNSTLQPNAEEQSKIEKLAQDKDIHKKIFDSIAPSICGQADVKKSLAYAQFGGVTRTLPDITTRGESNVLIIGDPGIAKTQMLLYMAKLAPRGIYAQGKGVTAVGLTAAVTQDKKGTLQLQAGTLVLADKGIACIDELDKMDDHDRVAIHEALEQHTVTISKGGIYATLNARTAVIAACNPTLGRYNDALPVIDNIKLPATLLSRFDLIFVLRDIPNAEADSKIASQILQLHRNQKQESPIPFELLRKYIAYSKNINPTLSPEASEKLKQFYLAMRSAAKDDTIPITPRQLESLVRLAEAHARMVLRPTGTVEDAKAAMEIMKVSLSQVGFDTETGKFDIDLIMTGITKNTRQLMMAIIDAVKKGPCQRKDVVALIAEKLKLPTVDVEKCIKQLLHDGTLFESHEGEIGRT